MSELVNTEAESQVLAAMLRYPEEFWSINSVGLVAKDFMSASNKRVMEAITRVVAERKEPDIPLVMEEVRLSGRDDTIEYVLKLSEVPCSIPQAHEYARTVKGLAASRGLADAGAKIIEVARANRSDYETAISESESLLAAVKRVLPPDERSGDPADILRRLRSSGPTDAVPLRFSPTLQRISGGLAPGHFWVVGGFSSVGKSAFAINMAIDTLYSRRWAGIMSVEMTSEQYMQRMLSLVSGVSQQAIRERITIGQGDKLNQAEATLSKAPLRIYDTAWKLEQIKSKAARMKETLGLDVLFVDFIQNVHVTGEEFADARTVALELQRLAKDLTCTVVAFSQVSNEMAKRDADGSDRNYYSFKGHGAIRDAADLAIMLRRDRINNATVLKVDVVKNRHGELAQINCDIQLETGYIEERVDPMGEWKDE